jgi:hypothetical protein
MEKAAVASAALAAALFAACSGLDAKTASFATLAEAQPAIDRGWVPAGLPPASYELRAAYVADGWQRWGIVNFPPAQADALRARLQSPEISLAGVRTDIPPRIEWWPVQLRQELDAERIGATGAKAYRDSDGNLIWVINWAQGRAYYWSTR